jgi:hypothetical protein
MRPQRVVTFLCVPLLWLVVWGLSPLSAHAAGDLPSALQAGETDASDVSDEVDDESKIPPEFGGCSITTGSMACVLGRRLTVCDTRVDGYTAYARWDDGRHGCDTARHRLEALHDWGCSSKVFPVGTGWISFQACRDLRRPGIPGFDQCGRCVHAFIP